MFGPGAGTTGTDGAILSETNRYEVIQRVSAAAVDHNDKGFGGMGWSDDLCPKRPALCLKRFQLPRSHLVLLSLIMLTYNFNYST